MAVNRNRLLVDREVASIDLDYQSLASILDDITAMIELYGPEAIVSKTSYPYSDGEYYAVYRKMEESDDQYNDRIKNEEYWQSQQDARDLVEYERLAAKFKK